MTILVTGSRLWNMQKQEWAGKDTPRNRKRLRRKGHDIEELFPITVGERSMLIQGPTYEDALKRARIHFEDASRLNHTQGRRRGHLRRFLELMRAGSSHFDFRLSDSL